MKLDQEQSAKCHHLATTSSTPYWIHLWPSIISFKSFVRLGGHLRRPLAEAQMAAIIQNYFRGNRWTIIINYGGGGDDGSNYYNNNNNNNSPDKCPRKTTSLRGALRAARSITRLIKSSSLASFKFSARGGFYAECCTSIPVFFHLPSRGRGNKWHTHTPGNEREKKKTIRNKREQEEEEQEKETR